MDRARRQTLKSIAGVAVASSVGVVLPLSTAHASPRAGDIDSDSVIDQMQSLSSIKVHTRVSSSCNDVEVVISNSGNQTTRITQMTPSQTSTARGVFDFHSLMKDGSLTLSPGQSVSVPMVPHASGAGGVDSVGIHARSLTKSLRASFSVVTDHDAYAMVDVIDGLRFT